jgi:glycosyltransferase involved in cell wall biosynthesis
MADQPLVSVIVPTYKSAAYLEVCLKSIADQTYPAVELIVVDNNSTDATKEIAGKYTKHVYNKGPERSAQRNYGVAQSKGEYALIIDSDMTLTPDVVKECVEVIQAHPEYKGLVVPEESFGIGFWAQCKKLERSFYLGVDWIEAARFFPRGVYDEMKGYDEDLYGAEDFDLPGRIKAAYGQDCIGRINALILHNEQRLSLRKTCGKKYYYARLLDVYKDKPANQANFKKQSSPLARYALFFSKPGKLLANPVVGVGMLYMKTAEMTAGASGYLMGKLRPAKA